MLIRIFPPLYSEDLVYPDSVDVMDKTSFSGKNTLLIAWFLFAGLRYYFKCLGFELFFDSFLLWISMQQG